MKSLKWERRRNKSLHAEKRYHKFMKRTGGKLVKFKDFSPEMQADLRLQYPEITDDTEVEYWG